MLVKRCSGAIFLIAFLPVFASLIAAKSLIPMIENTEINNQPSEGEKDLKDDDKVKPSKNVPVTSFEHRCGKAEEEETFWNPPVNGLTKDGLNPIIENTGINNKPSEEGRDLKDDEIRRRVEHLNEGHHFQLQMDMLGGKTEVVLDSTLMRYGPAEFQRQKELDWLVHYEVGVWCVFDESLPVNNLKPSVTPISIPYLKVMQDMTFYYHYYFKCVDNIDFACNDTDFDIEKKKPHFASGMYIPTTSLEPSYVKNWDKYFVCEVATNRSVTIYTIEERLNDLNISIKAYHDGKLDPVTKKTVDLQMEEMWHEWRETEINMDLEYRRLNNIRLYQGLEINENEERADEDSNELTSELISELHVTSASESAWKLDDIFGFFAVLWLLFNVYRLILPNN